MAAETEAALARLRVVVREVSTAAEGRQLEQIPAERLDRVTEQVRDAAALGATADEIAVAGHLSITDVRSVLGERPE